MQSQSTTATRLFTTRKIASLAVLSAIAYVVMLLGRLPIMPAVSFLKYDPKDVIITFGAFLFGPLSAAFVSLVVSVVEMLTVSSSGPVGLFMNILSTCAFACTAGYIYKKKQTATGAIVGLVTGVAIMTGAMILWNYFITPYYMGVSREDVAGMLLPVFLPFNLLKGGLNAALTMLLYKPLVKALRQANLVPERESSAAGSGKRNSGVILVSAILLISCVVLLLVLQGIL